MRSPLHNLIDASKPHETIYDKEQRVVAIFQDGVDVLKLSEEDSKKRARELRRTDRDADQERAISAAAAQAREGGPEEEPRLSPGKDARQTLEDMGITRPGRRQNVRAPAQAQRPAEPPPPPERPTHASGHPVTARELEQLEKSKSLPQGRDDRQQRDERAQHERAERDERAARERQQRQERQQGQKDERERDR